LASPCCRPVEVDAVENDAGIGRRRPQRHRDLAAAMQADAGGGDNRFERALLDHAALQGTVAILSAETRTVT
jgi:hypothetical protein